jgi:hypothetical protein
MRFIFLIVYLPTTFATVHFYIFIMLFIFLIYSPTTFATDIYSYKKSRQNLPTRISRHAPHFIIMGRGGGNVTVFPTEATPWDGKGGGEGGVRIRGRTFMILERSTSISRSRVGGGRGGRDSEIQIN